VSGDAAGDDDDAPIRVVHATAPVRVCDIGGWTDTWFARHGRVCSIAVQPGVAVRAAAYPRATRPDALVVNAVDYGDRLVIGPGRPVPARHRLLAAVADEATIPDDLAVELSVVSGVPPGCATGTSAAVAVAMMGALDHLAATRRTSAEIADAAHRVEVERLGLQSGVQDQLAAAYGGINHIEVTDYPVARVHPIVLADGIRSELERRIVLVYLGRAHQSSAVHEQVVAGLAAEGSGCPRLDALRRCAERAIDALARADWGALARVMVDSTEGQAALHPSVVSDDARRVIAVARANGALGWKVNGAGGEGGSLTLLCGSGADARRTLVDAVDDTEGAAVIPIRLSAEGLRRREE
jgi:D-glycero-alpha-D-manno-heptose-7-phosphate kinase